MNKRAQKLIFHLILLVGIYSFTAHGGALAQKAPSWKSLRLAQRALLEQVALDYTTDTNLDRSVNIGQMQLMVVQTAGAKPLFLVNTRLPGESPEANPTCGQAGCLFYGYIKSGKSFVRVLNGYINDFRVQNAPPVVQPTNRVVNQLPCLRLNSYERRRNRVLTSFLCFDGKEYQPTASAANLK